MRRYSPANSDSEHGMKQGVTIIIPTHNGGELFSEVLKMIGRQEYKGPIQMVVMDSGSTDGTAELAEQSGAQVKRIDKAEFHHARTRNRALSLAEFDRVVFMVQDALPVSSVWLSDLTMALDTSGAAAVYIDQIPHADAAPYARLETESTSRARGRKPVLQQLDSLESFHEMPYHKAYRRINLDNVCAVYHKALLLRTPFPEVAFAEDMAWALQMLLGGHKIFYQPAIKVKHSHNRSPGYGFRRQVINSVWCARIMNRVETDMSSLNVGDLVALTHQVEKLADRMRTDIRTGKNETGRRSGKYHEVVEIIVRTSSLSNRMTWLLYHTLFRKVKPSRGGLETISESARMRIQNAMDTITRRFRPTDQAEWIHALEQVSANVLGRIFGETYASCMVKGSIPSKMSRFMRPFMGGI